MFTNFILKCVRPFVTINYLLIVLCLAACGKHPGDPLEPMNRGMYCINKTVDRMYVKPVAQFYALVLPKFVQTGISNFFQNINTIPAMFNNVLQGKFAFATDNASRLILNSTLGIGGIFDVASTAHRTVHNADFGETLAVWGYRKSIYVVLPVFGPSTVRDTIGRGVTFFMSIWPYIPDEVGYYLYAANMLDTRVNLLKAESVLCTVAVDEYTFVRDAYFQRRCYDLTDGRQGKDEKLDILQGPPE